MNTGGVSAKAIAFTPRWSAIAAESGANPTLIIRRPIGKTIPSAKILHPDSAGINRHEVANERVVQERNSDPPGPEPCEDNGNGVLEALDRGICRLGIELRNG